MPLLVRKMGRFFFAAWVGVGCALYAPSQPFAPDIGAAARAIVWGAVGYALWGGLGALISRRLVRWVLPLSVALALSFVLGARLQVYGRFSLQAEDWLGGLVCWGGLCLLCFAGLARLFEAPPCFGGKRSPVLPPAAPGSCKKMFWLSFFAFCGLSLVWPLMYFPTIVNYDAYGHMLQVTQGVFHTHLPLLYTLMLSAFYRISQAFHWPNEMMFCMMSLIQLITMGLSFSYAFTTFYRYRVRRLPLMITLGYLCVFPLFGAFAYSSTKEGLFACFTLLTGVEFLRLKVENPTGRALWRMLVRLCLFSVLMCQFRYTGIAAFLLSGCTLVIQELRRSPTRRRRRRALAMAAAFALAFAVQTGLTESLIFLANATRSPYLRRDAISLPLQQLATAESYGDAADPDNRRINELFDVDSIGAHLKPHIADTVKDRLEPTEEKISRAISLWAELGATHSLAYAEAFLQLCRGSWYVDDVSHADVWKEGGQPMEDRVGYLELYQKQLTFYPMRYGSFLPRLRNFTSDLLANNRYLDIPILKYFFCPAVQSWITILGLSLSLYQKKRLSASFFLYALFCLLPVFFHPCAICRYFLHLYMLTPFALLTLALPEEKQSAALQS